MSTSKDFYEELRIGKDSPKGAEMIRALTDYIHQYNGMQGLENLDISYMELVCGDERAVVEDLSKCVSGNGWRVTPEKMEWHNEEHTVFGDDHPLIRLLTNLKPDRDITFRMSGSMTGAYIPDYTHYYWLKALEGITPEDRIDYRSCQAADTDELARAYHLNGSTTDQVPRDGSPELVADISRWYCGTFRIKVSMDNEDQYDDFEDIIGAAMQNLIDELQDEDLEPDVYEGEAELVGSLSLERDQLPALLKSLQEIADAATELDAEFECECEFLPDEKTDNGLEPFAVLRISCRDDRVEAKACRF